MRRTDRGADRGTDFIQTIEIKNKEGKVVDTKEVVTAKGLLHLAHLERLTKIRTRMIQFPTKENGETAIVTARVTTSRGSFTGIGDANPRNVNAKIASAFIRMAETRSLARALRAALDIGAVAVEELEEEFSFVDSKAGDRPAREAPHDAPTNGNDTPTNGERTRAPTTVAAAAEPSRGPSRDPGAMSEAQKRLLYRIAFEQGHEGDTARTWLHEQLRTESLSEVSKREASEFIDRFRQKEGGNGHAEPG